jgi:hypothetical protein
MMVAMPDKPDPSPLTGPTSLAELRAWLNSDEARPREIVAAQPADRQLVSHRRGGRSDSKPTTSCQPRSGSVSPLI